MILPFEVFFWKQILVPGSPGCGRKTKSWSQSAKHLAVKWCARLQGDDASLCVCSGVVSDAVLASFAESTATGPGVRSGLNDYLFFGQRIVFRCKPIGTAKVNRATKKIKKDGKTKIFSGRKRFGSWSTIRASLGLVIMWIFSVSFATRGFFRGCFSGTTTAVLRDPSPRALSVWRRVVKFLILWVDFKSGLCISGFGQPSSVLHRIPALHERRYRSKGCQVLEAAHGRVHVRSGLQCGLWFGFSFEQVGKCQAYLLDGQMLIQTLSTRKCFKRCFRTLSASPSIAQFAADIFEIIYHMMNSSSVKNLAWRCFVVLTAGPIVRLRRPQWCPCLQEFVALIWAYRGGSLSCWRSVFLGCEFHAAGVNYFLAAVCQAPCVQL